MHLNKRELFSSLPLAQYKACISVWGTLLVMTFAALACVAVYGRNIPLCEDWLLFAPLTDNEPNLFNWLWKQNNEHRTPLLRLIVLGVVAIFKDFRATMYFNVSLLGGVAAGSIYAARLIRGKTIIAVLILLPFNILSGFQGWGNWYLLRMSSFEKDMATGISHENLAERHQEFLIHWWEPQQIVSNIEMLEGAQIGPFAARKIVNLKFAL